MPIRVEIAGWSPFSPGDADNSSLPVAGLEYHLINDSGGTVEGVFSFNCANLMAGGPDPKDPNPPAKPTDRVLPAAGGMILYGPGPRAAEEGRLAVWTDEAAVQVNHAWFRGQPSDTLQRLWHDIVAGKCYTRAPVFDDSVPGATLFVPVTLAQGETKTIRVYFAWYVPRSNVFSPNFRVRDGKFENIEHAAQTYEPWYSGRFADIEAVKSYWSNKYSQLRSAAENFSHAFYDSTLPPEIVEAVAANLCILKSPTVLRQTDGRIWAWEGIADEDAAYGGGPGNCSHVLNYAQAMPHLFPALERTLRETEFGDDLGRDQAHRASLPIRPIGDLGEGRSWPAAADGQPGTIIRVYREWRISGETDWLRALWPKVRAAMNYCTATGILTVKAGSRSAISLRTTSSSGVQIAFARACTWAHCTPSLQWVPHWVSMSSQMPNCCTEDASDWRVICSTENIFTRRLNRYTCARCFPHRRGTHSGTWRT